jgi:putative ABC transport system permease protein
MMLFRLLSWPYLRRHALRWALTLAGIVLGVAVFVAMHTANRSIYQAFDRTVDQIAGATQLQVTAGEFGFEESILEKVQALPEVGVAVPIIEATLQMPSQNQGSILLLGVDMTGDRSLRAYDLEGDEGVVDDPLLFLAQPDSVILTKEFAERAGLGVNSRVRMLTIEGEKQFTVRGIMTSGGLSQAFGGNLAVMDIYAAQHILGRGPHFDRIDIRAKDGVSVEEAQAALRSALGAGFEIDPPSTRGRLFESLLSSYQFAVSISSVFALIVGMFIIYNSFAIAVTHRRAEVGILRALGATRAQIQRLFLLESALAGLFGSIIGAGLGLAGALAIAQFTSGILEQAGAMPQRVTQLSIDPTLVIIGIVIGISTSVVAAWIPARKAATVDPVQALQKGKYQVLSAGENRRRRWLALASFSISAICLWYSASRTFFYTGYSLMIITGLLLAPAFTLLLAKGLRPVVKKFVPAEGTLAIDSLIRAPRRTSATVAALMVSLAMVVGFGGFAHSFNTSINEWLANTLNPDFFVSASPNLTDRSMIFPQSVETLLENVQGVDQVQLIRNARIVFRGKPVMVIAFETTKIVQKIHPDVLGGNWIDMTRQAAEGKGLIISGSAAEIHKLKLRDVVDIPTPSGLLRLPIVGVIRDYSDLQGTLFLDRGLYSKWWMDNTANIARVYIKPGEDTGVMRERVITALGGTHLFVLTNREVRDFIAKVIDQWFAMTYNQIVLAIFVAVLGIVNTLTVSITDRRRELGVMQAVGGLRNQIRRTVWLEAISIAIIGLILGIGLGMVNLYYSLGTVKRDVGGLDLDYILPVAFIILMIPTIPVAAFIAAVGPGESAVRGSLVEALEYE